VTRPALLLLLLAACDVEGDVRRARANATPDGDTAAGADDTGEAGPDTVDVAHTREMRGLYVATVYNIDWPSMNSLSASAQQAEIVALLDIAEEAGINAVFVQIRPEGDALYRSEIEPWSDCLTGTQGTDPGYDPLAVWISEAHARGIEVHGWMNPYRAKAGSESMSGLASGHMALAFPQYAYGYGGDVWMDPGAAVVRGRVVEVVEDVVTRYDIDGIHFDDYFYPYPDDGDFPDDTTWGAYTASGGTLARDDWRRQNTADLVRDVSQAIAALDPTVRFGIAPFGIWRPGYPAGISGFDPWAGLYADPLDWVSNGWLDYVAPQLYWETTNSGQEYGLLAPWWDEQLPDGTWLFPANALYQLGSASTWTLDEYADQIAICRDTSMTHTRGNLWYNATPFIDGWSGVHDAFSSRYYPTPALPPVVNAVAGEREPPLSVTVSGDRVTWEPADGRRAVTVYTDDGGAWSLQAIVPADTGGITLGSGRWALASVGAGDVESGGVVVTLP
jgi:uncharacterized lipoprotein YddW (UPF0748 family)